MKRGLILILAFVVLAVSFGTSAFAVGNPTFELSTVTAHAGDVAKVSISLKNNPGIASAKLTVSFDTALELTGVEYNSALGGSSQQPQRLTSPVILNWYNGAANTNGDMVYATLTFKVSASASVGAHDITVTYDADDVYNIAETNINFDIVNGRVEVVEPKPVDPPVDPKSEYMLGDVNKNGVIDVVDYIMVKRAIIKSYTLDETQEKAADVNGDGKIDTVDYIMIKRHIVGSYTIKQPGK